MNQTGGEFFLRMCTPYAALRVLFGTTFALYGQAVITVITGALAAAPPKRSTWVAVRRSPQISSVRVRSQRRRSCSSSARRAFEQPRWRCRPIPHA
mgnify:CR=1 FL=1